MLVRLVITLNQEKMDDQAHEAAIGSCGEYFFRQSEISIGRDTSNDVHLIDPQRKVSRNHAKIIISESECGVEDLNSRNSTFVNEDRLKAGERRVLKNGDVVSIGSFDIRVFEDREHTVEVPAVNPFEDVVNELKQSFERVCSLYEREEGNRHASLHEAMRRALPGIRHHEAMQVVAHSLAEDEAVRPTRMASSPHPDLPTVSVTDNKSEGQEQVLDTLITVVKDLIQIPYRFRGEFIGSTMYQDAESTYLYEADLDVTKKYLLESALDTAETERKLGRLKKAAELVAMHQVGMLEGYRAIVREGIEELLKELDPERLELEVLESNMLAKVSPVFRNAQLVRTFKDLVADLRETDWTVTEQRKFRPIFVRAYLLSTSSS